MPQLPARSFSLFDKSHFNMPFWLKYEYGHHKFHLLDLNGVADIYLQDLGMLLRIPMYVSMGYSVSRYVNSKIKYNNLKTPLSP